MVCTKCRRLVRENYIYIDRQEYFCQRCNKHYVLSQKYINDINFRFERPIDSKIIINKTKEIFKITLYKEKSYLINIGSFKISLIIGLITIFMIFALAPLLYVVVFSFLSFMFFMKSLFIKYGKTTLLFSQSEISIHRVLFKIQISNRKKTSKFHKISIIFYNEFINVLNVEFEGLFSNITFGQGLNKKEKLWLIKEITYIATRQMI